MFKYLWKATFEHRTITQHPEDKYSKFDPKAEYNPSSFRDFIDYFDAHKKELRKFELISKENIFTIDFSSEGKPVIYCDRYGRYGSHSHAILYREKRPLHDIRVIYYRKCECECRNGVFGAPRVNSYVIGFQGLDENGHNRQKQISVI